VRAKGVGVREVGAMQTEEAMLMEREAVEAMRMERVVSDWV
jgi:hypothetical protein